MAGVTGEAQPLFSTGVIPSIDFNSVAVNMAAQYVPGPSPTSNLYTFNPENVGSDDQELFRLDHRVGSNDSIWWYSLFERNPETDPLTPRGATLPGFEWLTTNNTQQHTFAWSHVFNAATLNEFRLGYTRWHQLDDAPQKVIQPASAGFTGIVPQYAKYADIPGITISGTDVNFAIGADQSVPAIRINNTYQITDNFSKIVGKNTLKAGFEGRRYDINNPYYGLGNGNFNFTGSGEFSTGLPFADFLLGYPDSYSQSSGGIVDARAYELYSYAQDQFALRPNLTFTYGLSWDVESPLSDLANHGKAINCFSPGQQSTIFPTAPAGLIFPGDHGCSSAGYSAHYASFSPRVGFAWSPDLGRVSGGPGKFSIRGGFGLYFDRSEEFNTLQNLSAPPYQLLDSGISDVGGVPSLIAPFTDVRCIDQHGNAISSCAPSGPQGPTPASIPNKYPFTAPAAGSSVNFGFYEPMSLNVIDPHFGVPYVENFNLTVERELPGQLFLSVGYVGSAGHHLVMYHELNPAIDPQACLSNAGSEAGCSSIPLLQYLLYPQNFQYNSDTFGSIGEQSTMGNSNFNSLQVRLQNSPSHGLSFGVAYTYGHSLDNVTLNVNGQGADPFNFRRFYGDSVFDARQRLVAHYIYSVPSVRHFESLRWIPKLVADGWHVAGITTFQTGFPVEIADLTDGFFGATSLTCPGFISFYSCWDVPNVSGPVSSQNPRASGNYWFNPDLFSHAALGSMGDASRTSVIHGPGINNWDVQLSKDFPVNEQLHFVLRAELFNGFNHAQFSNPDGNLGDGSVFGTITSTRSGPRVAQLAVKFYF